MYNVVDDREKREFHYVLQVVKPEKSSLHLQKARNQENAALMMPSMEGRRAIYVK
jgi:hypothetical protein